MLQFDGWKVGLIVLTVLLGVVFAFPNAFYAQVERSNDARIALERGAAATPELTEAAESWPSFLPSSLVNLGLDLRGGAHVLVEVAVDDVHTERVAALWPELRNALRNLPGVSTVVQEQSGPDELRARIDNEASINAALSAARRLTQPIVSLTGIGTTDFEVTSEGPVVIMRLSEAEKLALNERTMLQSLEIIRRRVDESGTREPTIQRQGADRILVQVPGIGSAEELLELIGQTAKLNFHRVVGNATSLDQRPGAGNVIYEDEEAGEF
ncbi:MAG: protein translocase subunit SecD, partial [Pseudomonadota bacterium]